MSGKANVRKREVYDRIAIRPMRYGPLELEENQ